MAKPVHSLRLPVLPVDLADMGSRVDRIMVVAERWALNPGRCDGRGLAWPLDQADQLFVEFVSMFEALCEALNTLSAVPSGDGLLDSTMARAIVKAAIDGFRSLPWATSDSNGVAWGVRNDLNRGWEPDYLAIERQLRLAPHQIVDLLDLLARTHLEPLLEARKLVGPVFSPTPKASGWLATVRGLRRRLASALCRSPVYCGFARCGRALFRLGAMAHE